MKTCNLSKQTTYILKRRVQPFLHKKGAPLKKLRSRHYVYELVEDTNRIKQPDIEVILTKYVEGLGNVGQKVSVKPFYAYNQLLLPGLAVYTTQENIEKYENKIIEDVERYSTPTASKVSFVFK